MGDGHFTEDEGIENRQDVPAVGEHAFEHTVIEGIALGQALPALQDTRWDVNVLAQLLERMAAHKEGVKERRFVLGFRQIEVRSGHMLGNPKQDCSQKKACRTSKILACRFQRESTMMNQLSSPNQCSCGFAGGFTSDTGARL
jgi:hypothetical protein